MRIDQSTQDGCAILAPVGELDLAAVPSLRHVLLKRLAEQPVAVICDMAGLWSVDPACAAVFATVANHPSSRWPETTLLLCGAQPAVRRSWTGWGRRSSCRCMPAWRMP